MHNAETAPEPEGRRVTTTEDNEAHGRCAVEIIADALREVESDYAPGSASKLVSSRRILDALAAEGYAVVHVEPPTAPAKPDSVWDLIRRVVTDPLVLAAVEKAERGESGEWMITEAWEPVPESSALGGQR